MWQLWYCLLWPYAHNNYTPACYFLWNSSSLMYVLNSLYSKCTELKSGSQKWTEPTVLIMCSINIRTLRSLKISPYHCQVTWGILYKNCHKPSPLPTCKITRANKHRKTDYQSIYHAHYKSSPVITMSLSYNVSMGSGI